MHLHGKNGEEKPREGDDDGVDTIIAPSSTDDEKNTETDDATTTVPYGGHEEEDTTSLQTSCSFTMYSRRGTYLAVGHASGAVAIFDSTARTLVALYYYYCKSATATAATIRSDKASLPPVDTIKTTKEKRSNFITCASWSRKGTVLWISSKFQCVVQRVNLHHPNPDYYILNPTSRCNNSNTLPMNSKDGTSPGTIVHLDISIMNESIDYDDHAPFVNNLGGSTSTESKVKTKRNSEILAQVVELPMSVNSKTGCIPHPREDYISMANLSDGSLVILYFPPFTSDNDMDAHDGNMNTNDSNISARLLYIVPPSSDHFINSATFDATGHYVLAITSSGVLLGFELKPRVIEHFNTIPHYVYVTSLFIFERSISSQCNRSEQDKLTTETSVNHKINDNKSSEQAYEIISTRNGDLIAINCFTEIKLYDIKALLQQQPPADAIKPRQVFSDPINKSYFVSCDFSGDGEYIVGGKNNCHTDSKYELYIWNTTTGVLLDRLTGPQTMLHHLAWHPNRSLLAAATADGLVDIWGPRIDWTAFAPDFQALPSNVEYVEQEDEFDVVIDEDGSVVHSDSTKEHEDEGEEALDVVTVERIPAFESDSEDDVFYFLTTVNCLLNKREKRNESQML